MVAYLVDLSSENTNNSFGSSPKLMNMNSTGMPVPIERTGSGLSTRSRRPTKLEIADLFITKLRSRNNIDCDAPGFVEGIKEHFEKLPSRYEIAKQPILLVRLIVCFYPFETKEILPTTLYACRYAWDVNINTLDVLNHKRLLDSARADPSAVSFQIRPVDVVGGIDMARKPSFGSFDTLAHQAVRPYTRDPSYRTSPTTPSTAPVNLLFPYTHIHNMHS